MNAIRLVTIVDVCSAQYAVVSMLCMWPRYLIMGTPAQTVYDNDPNYPITNAVAMHGEATRDSGRGVASKDMAAPFWPLYMTMGAERAGIKIRAICILP